MKKIVITLLLLTNMLFADMFLEVKSKVSVDEAVKKISLAIDKHPAFSVFLIVDHKKNAKSVNLDMPDTKLIIFGNPKAGTKLMSTNSYMAYELPLKILVSSRNGKTIITYRDPDWLVKSYSLEKSPIIPKMKKMMKIFSSAGK